MRRSAKDAWTGAARRTARAKECDAKRRAFSPDSVRVAGFEDAKAIVAKGRLRGAEIDTLLRIAYDDPPNGEAAIYALSFAQVRRRDRVRVVRSLLCILADARLEMPYEPKRPKASAITRRPSNGHFDEAP